MKSVVCIVCTLLVATTVADVRVALYQRNIDVLLKQLDVVSDPLSVHYQQFWSAEEINNLLRQPWESHRAVQKWFYDCGFKDSDWWDLGDAYRVSGPQWKLELCFGYGVPQHLNSIVHFVSNLNRNIDIADTRYSVPHDTNFPDSGYVGRETIANVYNVSDYSVRWKDDTGIPIGVVEFGQDQGYSLGGVHTYQHANGLQISNVTNVGSYGVAGTEGELDIQMIANAEGADLWFITVDGWLYDFAVEYLNWNFTDTTGVEKPWILSISYGWAESSQCEIATCTGNMTSEHYVNRTNVEFAKLALTGVTIVVASGDAGSPSRIDEGCTSSEPAMNPDFPAASPYVLSVGATYVYGDGPPLNQTLLCQQEICVSGTQQSGTYFNVTNWTSGGGFSNFAQRPWWQDQAVAKYFRSQVPLPPSQNYNGVGRGYPDVAAIGHNCAIYGSFYGGGTPLTMVDGTSCSSPIMASLIGVIATHRTHSCNWHGKLGLVAPTLYYLAATEPQTFLDITEGVSYCTEYQCCSSEHGFEAWKGWDPVGGLGSLDVGRVVEYV